VKEKGRKRKDQRKIEVIRGKINVTGAKNKGKKGSI
jgi:hypothetical protein